MKALLIIFMLILVSCEDDPHTRDWRSEAYSIYKIVWQDHRIQELKDQYEIIYIDDFISKSEFDLFYTESCKALPHLKKYEIRYSNFNNTTRDTKYKGPDQ